MTADFSACNIIKVVRNRVPINHSGPASRARNTAVAAARNDPSAVIVKAATNEPRPTAVLKVTAGVLVRVERMKFTSKALRS